MLDPVNPRAPQFGPRRPAGRQAPVVEPGRLTPRQVNEQVDAFLVANKARVRINDGGRDHGQIRAFNNPSFDGATAPPTMILRNEDFGRIARLLADGRPSNSTSTSSIAGTRRAGPPTTPSPRLPARTRRAK